MWESKLKLALIATITFLFAGATAFAQCPTFPDPVIDITSNRFYTDSHHSIPDLALVEKRKASLKPLTDFQTEIVRYANRAFDGNKAAGHCVSKALVTWAQAGAMLGKMNEIQAEYERVWVLTSLSFSYIKVKNNIDAADRTVIEPWLSKLAAKVKSMFDNPKIKRNNHYYWNGLAVAAAALATEDFSHWHYARKVFDAGLSDIDDRGVLPFEAARKSMALHYHNFSLLPLIMLAELAAQKGEDWYQHGAIALIRLTLLVLSQNQNSAILSHIAGAEQKPLDEKALVWFPFFKARFPEQASAYSSLATIKFWSTYIGGETNKLATAWVR